MLTLDYLLAGHLSLVPIPPYIFLCNVKGRGTGISLPHRNTLNRTLRYVLSAIIARPYIRMPIGTSDTTVISSIKPRAHNLNPTSASAPLRDGPSPANLCATAAENCRIVSLVVVGNRMYTFASEMVVIIVVTALSLA